MVVILLYAMQSRCNALLLSLSGSDSRRSTSLARRQRCYDGDQRCHAGDDGDHNGASKMEITSTR